MPRKGTVQSRSLTGPVNAGKPKGAKYYLGTTLANGALVDLYVGDGSRVFAKYADGEEISAPLKDVDCSTAELYVAKFLAHTNKEQQCQGKQKRRSARR